MPVWFSGLAAAPSPLPLFRSDDVGLELRGLNGAQRAPSFHNGCNGRHAPTAASPRSIHSTYLTDCASTAEYCRFNRDM